jgi:hypothetical protein
MLKIYGALVSWHCSFWQLGPALDGASLKEAATVPALMAVWAGVVVLIEVGPR